MDWKNVFNTNHKHWGHIDLAAKAAREAGYPMICWNGRVYAIPKDGIVDLRESFCLVEDLK